MASNRVKLSTEFNSALSRASAPRRPRHALITVVWAPGPGVRSVTWENYESWSWMTANNGNRQPRLSSELALWLRERAAILLRTFNYLAQSHIRNRNVYLHKTENNVNHVSFVCLRISTIFAKKCPKKLSMIMRYIFGQHQHGQFGNITHPPRHCYWGTRVVSVTCLFFIETRVVTMPWKITLQQHDIVWKPLCRCFWLTLNSPLHDALRRSFHWPIRGPSLWSSSQLEARI